MGNSSPSSIQSLKEIILEEWKKNDVALMLFILCLEDLVLSLKWRPLDLVVFVVGYNYFVPLFE